MNDGNNSFPKRKKTNIMRLKYTAACNTYFSKII